MRYKFPRTEFLSEVEPYLNDSFYVKEKDGYIVVNYLNNSTETFPDVWDGKIFDHAATVRRECRGLIFDAKTKRVIARRLHKFWNLNERLETAEENIPDKHSMRVYEKLDGSMITPIYLESGIRWGTKAGITDVGMQAETFVGSRLSYIIFANWCKSLDLTPIFEWCSRKNTIVVDHPVDRLVLLDVRDMVTGKYVPRQNLIELSEKFNIELVKEVKSDFHTIRDKLKDNTTDEGIVLQYEDGHRVKVKTEWYVALHRAKEAITRERDVVMLILDAKLDDLKPLLNAEDLESINRYEKEFWNYVNITTDKIKAIHKLAQTMTRKEFALSNVGAYLHKAMVFKLLDKVRHFEYFEEVLNSIRKYPVQRSIFTKKLHEFLEWEFDWKGTPEDDNA